MKFTSFIKKQRDRNDPLGDFARDFLYIVKNLPDFPECRGTDEIESETLLGHYNFLPPYAQNKNYVLESLCNLWKEWIAYKHIGLQYAEPTPGYVYFLNLIAEPSIYKIGRTSRPPLEYLHSIESREKAKFEACKWIKIRNYDLIEKELHTFFKNNQVVREFFKLSKDQVDTAIEVYQLIDEDSKVFPDDFESMDEI